jgi:hypothetical protein
VSETGVYVYGVAPADIEAPEGVAGVDPTYPVELVRDGGLAAIASRVDLADFGGEALAERALELDWVAPRALAHEEVLDQALRAGRSLLPFRFGTIYFDTAQVTALLHERSRELSDALERVRDRVELGVRAALDRGRAEAAVLEFDPELARLAAEIETSPSGAAYMRRKQLERLVEAAVDRTAAALADDVHEQLAAVAEDARSNPPRDRDDGLVPILNGAYLVERGRRGDFEAEVERLAAGHVGEGLVLEPTGPWPPYNFVPEDPAS